jgi:hypothetical protein
MSAWQPIETAPKDGTSILLALEYQGKFFRYIAKWNDGLNCWLRDETGSAVFPKHMQGWFSHWMPLPPPPRRMVEPAPVKEIA